MNGEQSTWSILENSVTPGMPNLQDLDPEFVADRANREAFAEEQPQMPSPQDMKEQMASLLQQKQMQKAMASAEFQAKAAMMNRSSGK